MSVSLFKERTFSWRLVHPFAVPLKMVVKCPVLPPQIDGSTLRTLCLQHGPLITFHLNLTQGNAVVRYSSKEEAAKAQKSLHMYVSPPAALRCQVASSARAPGGASCPGAASTPPLGLCATGAQPLMVLGPGSLRSRCHQGWLLLRPLSPRPVDSYPLSVSSRGPPSVCGSVLVYPYESLSHVGGEPPT